MLKSSWTSKYGCIVLKALEKSKNIRLTELLFSLNMSIYFLKCIKQHLRYTCLSYRQIVMGQCNLSLNFPIYRKAMYVLWQTKNRRMSCGRPEMRTGHTRKVMHVLWQTRNAYKTYQKCDAGPVAGQKCVQDIPEMWCIFCGRPELRTGHTRNAMHILWQTRNTYRIYIYVSEMRCMSCGRPEMCTGHTRNVMQVLWHTRISICPRVLQNLPCCKTQKTRNPFQHKILISVLSLSVCCCMRWMLHCNWPHLSHGLSFQPSFIPASLPFLPLSLPCPPPSLPLYLPCPLPPYPSPPLPCPLPPYSPSPAPPSLPLSLTCPPPSYPPYPSPSPARSPLPPPSLPLSLPPSYTPYPSPSPARFLLPLPPAPPSLPLTLPCPLPSLPLSLPPLPLSQTQLSAFIHSCLLTLLTPSLLPSLPLSLPCPLPPYPSPSLPCPPPSYPPYPSPSPAPSLLPLPPYPSPSPARSLLTPLPPSPAPLPLTLLTPLPPLPLPLYPSPSPAPLPPYPFYPSPSPAPPPLHSSLHSILLSMPPCFRMQPPPPPPPHHCWSFSLLFILTLSSLPSSKLHLNLNYAVLVLRCVCVCRSKREKVQMNAYFFWHGHTVCQFSGKSPFSSHKTTLKIS